MELEQQLKKATEILGKADEKIKIRQWAKKNVIVAIVNHLPVSFRLYFGYTLYLICTCVPHSMRINNATKARVARVATKNPPEKNWCYKNWQWKDMTRKHWQTAYLTENARLNITYQGHSSSFTSTNFAKRPKNIAHYKCVTCGARLLVHKQHAQIGASTLCIRSLTIRFVSVLFVNASHGPI